MHCADYTKSELEYTLKVLLSKAYFSMMNLQGLNLKKISKIEIISVIIMH